MTDAPSVWGLLEEEANSLAVSDDTTPQDVASLLADVLRHIDEASEHE